MTRSELRTEVRGIVKEATAVFWSNAQLDTYLNDALLVYTSRLGLRTKEKTTSAILDQEDYLLPSDFVIPPLAGLVPPPAYYVKLGGKPLQYLSIGVYQMIRGYGNGATLGTVPVFFTYFNQGDHATAGLLLALKLLPTPTSTGVNNLAIGFESKAPTMTADADIPNIPHEDHVALAWGAAASAYLQRGQTEEAAVYQAMFDRRIVERLPGGGESAAAQ